jgi:hypothetical protein
MEGLIITLLKILLLSNVISSFEPLEILLSTYFGKYMITSLFLSIVTCLTCVSFWVGLIYTHNLWIASAAFTLAYIFGYIKTIVIYLLDFPNRLKAKKLLDKLNGSDTNR